ncbi:hypothetical protein [Caenimonas aquaedulcis]|uniref:Tetratricopeptide repeat protein n=1 Tax=Caenimonas aquaedulcis TaxID=2793270 RepID=A0A931H0W7_9BURK|nr:hypothetical protein [Caenimonas aquaedulcis]MBG9386529.1 hypothetical protein [Caenimonas aquaedulcis]
MLSADDFEKRRATLVDAGRFRAARALEEQYLRDHPRDISAYRKTAETLAAMGNYAESVRQLELAIAIKPQVPGLRKALIVNLKRAGSRERAAAEQGLLDELLAVLERQRSGTREADASLAKARSAIGAGDWTDAFRLVHACEQQPESSRALMFRLHCLVHGWAAALRLEQNLVRELGLDAPSRLPLGLAMLGIRARLSLGLSREGLDLARGVADANPAEVQPRIQVANALAQLGNHAEAMTLRMGLWNDGEAAMLLPVIAGFVTLRDIEAGDAFLASAEGRGRCPDPVALGRARIALHRAKGEHDAAFEATLALEAHLDEAEYAKELARQACDSRRSDVLNTLLERLVGWAASASHRALYLKAGPQILRAHFACLLNAGAIRPSMQALEAEVLSPAGSNDIAGILLAQGEYRRCEAFLQAAVSRFPSIPGLWTKLLTALGLMDDQVALASARAQLKACMPPTVALDIMAGGSANAWDVGQLPELLEHALSSPNANLQERFFVSMRRLTFEPGQIAGAIETTVARSSALNASRLQFIMSYSRDRQLWDSSVTTPVPFSAFQESRRVSAAQIAASLARCVSGDAARELTPVGRRWMEDCIGFGRRIEAGADVALMQTADSFADCVALARVLIERIRLRQPTSALRIGDGEGHMLPAHPFVADRVDEDRAFIQNIWWGAGRLTHRRAERIEEDFRLALRRCDIIGVVPPWRYVRDTPTKGELIPQHRGIFNSLAYLAGSAERIPVATSAHFHHDLHIWNLWGEIFGAVRSVSWISCHDMSEYLRKARGVATRQRILIPPEQRWAGLFKTRAPGDSRPETLLDLHDDICAAISPLEGEVYLVAAGFLGKLYCDLVCRRGGIAIDIGSLADYWMGFATRDYRLDQEADVAISSTFVTGHDLPRTDTRERILGIPGAVRSTLDGRYNMATEEDAHAAASVPRHQRLLRIVGHPRCASGFMATLFSEHGLEIGHEVLLKDGISSWMSVVADLQYPFGESTLDGIDFEHTLLHVRDPRDAIPSIVLENGIARSFAFRRQHILRATGEDIARYDRPLERATASYVHWHRMALDLQPEAVIRVEDAAEAVPRYLSGWYARDTSGATRQTAGVVGYNATQNTRRFSQPKPKPGRGDWLSMSPALVEALDGLCERFGYVRPWMHDAGAGTP